MPTIISPLHMCRNMLASAIIAFTLTGCVSVGLSTKLPDYKHRMAVHQDGGIQVSASTLSSAESHAVYGVALGKKGIQPVWIEVENHDKSAYWLMFPGVDPNFFPPSEAADAFNSKQGDNILEQRFQDLAFQNPIPPGATSRGFVLTNLDEAVKMVQVDLIAHNRHKSFSFVTPVPGFRADHNSRKSFLRQGYSNDEIRDFEDDKGFRAALASLPCCVTNKKGSRNGDPLNLVVVGGLNDAFPALIRRGWRPAEKTWLGSVTRIIKSGLSGARYPYAPISPLYLYGRSQDIALQKARDNIHQRNHLRLWRSPMRYRGKPVWVGQISRDIGSRLTIHSPYLTTHKIDPDVDEARAALVEDLAYSQNLARMELVNGVGQALKIKPQRNLTTDPYFTDGFRAVLIFDVQPRSLDEIQFLTWKRRDDELSEKPLSEKL